MNYKILLKPIEVEADSEQEVTDNFNEGEYHDKIELDYVLPPIPNQLKRRSK